MNQIPNIEEFYKKLGYTLIDIKSSVFREEESTLVFQTDNKNHTVDGSTILYDHAVAIHHQLQKAREEERKQLHNRLTGWEVAISTGEEDIDALTLCKELHKALNHSELDQAELEGGLEI